MANHHLLRAKDVTDFTYATLTLLRWCPDQLDEVRTDALMQVHHREYIATFCNDHYVEVNNLVALLVVLEHP